MCPALRWPRLTGYTAVQISRIRRRFAEEGLAGLSERPRLGRPARLTEAKGARIVALTLKAPPQGLTQCEHARAGSAGGGLACPRIWEAHALQAHRVESFKCRGSKVARAAS